MSLQIQEENTKFSSTLDAQDNKIYSFKTSYDEHPEKMSASNNFSTKTETAKTEPEATINTKIDELKTDIKTDNTTQFNFLDMKLSARTSNKKYSSCDQSSDYIIQWPLL